MASPDGSIARRFAVLTLLLALGGVGRDVVAQGADSRHRAGPEPTHHRHHDHLVPGDDVHPDEVDAPLRRVRRPGRVTGRAGRRGGDRRGDALTRATARCSPRRAVRDGAVVRQRERLVVRVQLRCAVVECVPRVAFRLHHHICSDCRCWPCWWRRGSTSPVGALTATDAPMARGAELPRRRWRLPPGRSSSSRSCR